MNRFAALFLLLFPLSLCSYDAIVVGAGISGLAVANHLQQNGYNVLVIEAKDRIGGRIWTTTEWGFPLEHGANWIHNIENNPIYDLAQKLQLKTIQTVGEAISTRLSYFESYALFDAEGKRIPEEEIKVVLDEVVPKFEIAFLLKIAEAESPDFQELISDFAKAHPEIPKRQLSILNYMITLLAEFDFGADPGTVSPEVLMNRLEKSNTSGPDVILSGGYSQITSELAKNIPVILNTPVKKISIKEGNVEVVTDDQTYIAPQVVVTVPLGVLKAGAIKFDPPLPEEKKQAIDRLGMGVINKIFLLFETPFWSKEVQWFGLLPSEKTTIETTTFNFFPFLKKPILLTFFSGSFASHAEKWGDQKTVDYLMKRLKTMFGESIPSPTAYVITRWESDPYTRGGYSYPKIGSSIDDYATLAAPIEGRIFFAGEATSTGDADTVHGAYQSGLDAAYKMRESRK